MNNKNRKSPGSLAEAAAVLGLALAAVSAMPAAAEDAPKAPAVGKTETSQPAASAEDKTEASTKASNPCAVKKNKKKKGPCAAGG